METRQVASIFFLSIMSMPLLLTVADYFGPAIDIILGFVVALVGSMVILYFVKSDKIRPVLFIAAIAFGPTLFFWNANPSHVSNKNFGQMGLKTTSPEFIQNAQGYMGPLVPILRMLSLVSTRGVSISGIRRDQLIVEKTKIKLNKNDDLFPMIEFEGKKKMQMLTLKTVRRVKGRNVYLEMPVLVPAIADEKDEYDEDTYKRTVYPAWHKEYEPTEEELKPSHAGAVPPDSDVLWMAGQLVEFDNKEAQSRGLFKKNSHVRPMALICDNGGGIGLAPEGSTVLGASALLLPLALFVAQWIMSQEIVETKSYKKCC